MPPTFLFDLSKIDLNGIEYDQEAVRRANPQRRAMEHLNGIIWSDREKGQVLGFKNVRDDEFWVDGHIPGRPLLPGVMMIECAAQLASFYSKVFLEWKGFIGFGAVDGVKFRQEVVPGQRLLMLAQHVSQRHRRISCVTQGVVNGSLVFEAEIVGVKM